MVQQHKIREGVPYTDGKSIRVIVDTEAGSFENGTPVYYRTTRDLFKEVHECSLGAFARWATLQHEELSDQIVLAIRPNNGADVLPDNLETRVTRILKTEILKIEAGLGTVSFNKNVIPAKLLRQLIQDYETLYGSETLNIEVVFSLFLDGAVDRTEFRFKSEQ